MEPAGIEVVGSRARTWSLTPRRTQPSGTTRVGMWKLVPSRARTRNLGGLFQKLQKLASSRPCTPLKPVIGFMQSRLYVSL
jgi:hypothetical protein